MDMNPSQVDGRTQLETADDQTQKLDTPDKDHTGSIHSGDSSDLVVSQTSTQEFHHEPFGTYAVQVKELCLMLWPSFPNRRRNRIIDIFRTRRKRDLHSSRPSSSDDFHIERLKGGGFNRVLGIDINVGSKEQTQFILRVPRFLDARPDREVAILKFVQKHPSIPVAEVKASDFTKDNPLKSPYVVQTRLSGHDLQSHGHAFDGLKHGQQCSVAKELGRILRSIQDIENTSPGRIDMSTSDDSKQDFVIRPFEVYQTDWNGDILEKTLDDASHATSQSEYNTIADFLVSQFDRWKAANRSSSGLTDAYMDSLVLITYQLEKLGYLGDDEYCLCHLDLNSAPRNIMVDIQNGSASITGILDWDSAIFAPKFVACAPPMWCWAWSNEEDEDERKANDTPSTPERKELKALFENAVGANFLEYCYQPEYRLARTLFNLALHGIHSSWAMTEADELIREWETMIPPEMKAVKGPRDYQNQEEGCATQSDESHQSYHETNDTTAEEGARDDVELPETAD